MVSASLLMGEEFIKISIKFYKLLSNPTSCQQMSICIATKYVGAQWAGKILSDWNCDVVYSNPVKQTTILITSEDEKDLFKEFNHFHIVVTGTSTSNVHSLAQSGVLSTFGQEKDVFVPKFIVQSVVANSLAILCLQHLYDKKESKKQQFNVSIVELLKYYGTFFLSAKENHMMGEQRGKNMLEGGAPYYSVYKAKEGNVAVGNLQPKFYKQMIKGLSLTDEQKQIWEDNQLDMDEWPKMRKMLAEQFSKKTAKEWEDHFRRYDTCITEIKTPFKSNIVEPKLSPLPKL